MHNPAKTSPPAQSHASDDRRKSRRVRFVSLRWRFIFPLAVVVLIVAMVGAYGLARNLTTDFARAEENVLLQSTRAVIERSADIYQRHRAEAQRIAFTGGLADAVQGDQVIALQALLRPLLVVSGMDSIILTDTQGREIIGLLRVPTPANAEPEFVISRDTLLGNLFAVRDVLDVGEVGATSLLRTPEGILVYTAVPLRRGDERLGVVLVGQQLDTLLEALKASAIADVTLYDDSGAVLQTTVDLDTALLNALQLDPLIIEQTVTAARPVRADAVFGQVPYRAIFTPFVFGNDTLGIVSTAMANNVPFATEIGRQLTAVFAAVLAGAAVIVAFIGINAAVLRVNRVRRTTEALAQGQRQARTHMPARDEIGLLAQAVDAYADHVQVREDQFKSVLRKQRRERNYLMAVLESMPDGVFVQDKGGHVIMMNDTARTLLGSQEAFQRAGLHQLEQNVPHILGDALAAGIYALGDPRQVAYEGKMLSAQAAAVLSTTKQRVGTVVVVRDITEQVQQEQARERVLHHLLQDVQQPLAGIAQRSAIAPNLVGDFAREVSRHAAMLQKMIVDMRELTRYDRRQSQQMQRPIRVETLVWAVANDWRQIAQAADLDLQVMMPDAQTPLFILGDEGRLREALGNIVDNAIKYTPAGGIVSLEIRGENHDTVHLRVRDNGVGITDVDMPHVFMPFYRGTPVMSDGTVIRVPGMGQGLPIAQQIIEAHGGIVRIKSKLDVGTATYIALPLTSGVGYELPRIESAELEGETVRIPDGVDIETYWRSL